MSNRKRRNPKRKSVSEKTMDNRLKNLIKSIRKEKNNDRIFKKPRWKH